MYRILVIILIFIFSDAHASDAEIATSLKCANWFRAIEKKYNIPTDLLYSISLHETSKKHSVKKGVMVWPWTVNSKGKGVYFSNKSEAVKFVYDQLSKGNNSIDVGCMQVNMKYHGIEFQSLEHIFDPKINIEYAAQFLKKNYDKLGSWEKAVANYHTTDETRGQDYLNKVNKVSNNISKHKSIYQNPHAKNNNGKASQRLKKPNIPNVPKKKSKIMVRVPKRVK